MANKVTFDYSKATGFVQEHEMAYMSELVAQAKDKLVAKSGAGNDFLGWIDLPVDYDKEEFVRIQKAAEKIRKRFRSTSCDRNRRILSRSESCH